MADSKKYDGSTWEHSLRELTTATADIEPTIYTDGTAITSYTIKGNTVQDGTPTPTNPIAVNGVGELVGSDYQIPISNGQQTTNIYLESTQSTRQIKKMVLTGDEASSYSTDYGVFYMQGLITDYLKQGKICVCSHFQPQNNVSSIGAVQDGVCFHSGVTADRIYFKNPSFASKNEWTQYLAAQYAAGTPVTVWYVLQTATTGTVNEPLMKIGDYADTLSNAASIPTTEGANSITVDTTVQPSEFSATWTGWHNASVKEYDGSQWNE